MMRLTHIHNSIPDLNAYWLSKADRLFVLLSMCISETHSNFQNIFSFNWVGWKIVKISWDSKSHLSHATMQLKRWCWLDIDCFCSLCILYHVFRSSSKDLLLTIEASKCIKCCCYGLTRLHLYSIPRYIDKIDSLLLKIPERKWIMINMLSRSINLM